MTTKKILGTRGEKAAKDWLERQGYQIIGQNIRLGHQELDLIAEKDDLTIFVEVKTGYYAPTDLPVQRQQQHSLKIARAKYCQIHNIQPEKTRLDLIIITPQKSSAKLEYFANFLF